MRDVKKTVGAMAGRAKTAYLSYIDSQGYPTTRAMLAPREREGIRVFWFSTNTSSPKAAAFRAKSEMIHHLKGTPAVINTEENAAFGQKVVAELFGEDCFYDMPPLMAGEDFAIFMEKVGGLFVFVGGGFRDKESAPHHNGHFDIDEDSLRISAALHAQYAIQYLASHT